MFNPIILALLIAACEPMPEPPSGASLAFVCTWHGVQVLEGWVTVTQAKAEIAEKYDLGAYWLDCDSASMDGLKCRTASQ